MLLKSGEDLVAETTCWQADCCLNFRMTTERMRAVLSQSISDNTVAICASQQNIYWWIFICQNFGVKKAVNDKEAFSLLPRAL